MSQWFRRSSSIYPSPGQSPSLRGTTYSVPLFISESFSNTVPQMPAVARTRSASSTRSIIDEEAAPPGRMPVVGLPSFPRPGGPTLAPRSESSGLAVDSRTNLHDIAEHSILSSTQRSTRSRSTSTKRVRSGTISRASFRDRKVRNKLRLTIAFGITLLAAIIIYLSLALMKKATAPMFHVLSILFILALTGVFCHSFIRMWMLILRPSHHCRRRKTRRHYPRGQGRLGYEEYPGTYERSIRSGTHLDDDQPPDKPIPIHMASDDDDGESGDMYGPSPSKIQSKIKPPPPVYGNYRNSTRMNPNYIYIQPLRPTSSPTDPSSPQTPTYDEAMQDVQRVVGGTYRPPGYFDRDATPADPYRDFDHDKEQNMRESDVQRADDIISESMHPLERERVRYLTSRAPGSAF